MPKMSDATKAKIAAYEAKVQELMKEPPAPWFNIHPKNVGRKHKSTHEKVLCRKITLSAEQTAWILGVKKLLQETYPYYVYAISGGFIAGACVEPNANYGQPFKFVPTSQSVGGIKRLKNGTVVDMRSGYQYGAANWVANQPITAEAYAMSWPDMRGQALLYMHTATYDAHVTVLKGSLAYKPPTLIKENINDLADWNVLADYIQWAQKVNRQDVCDIMRAIAANESKKELEQEQNA